ncbi:MAG: hypothetical protein ACJASR_000132 [Psychroserpens sp.]|jgi:hypothetical protein
MNIEILTEILTSTDDYYIGTKRGITTNMTQEKYKDEVIFFSPPQVKRGLARNDITLRDLEELENAPILTNIWLSNKYPPFQHGFSLSDISQLHCINSSSHDFLREASNLKSSDIWEYEQIDKILNIKENDRENF